MLSEIEHTLETLRDQLEALAVRGLRAAGPEHLAQLKAAQEEFERIGAAHLAERIAAVVQGVERQDRAAAAALLSALTSLRLFDRILTLEIAESALAAFATEPELADRDGGPADGEGQDGERPSPDEPE